MESFWLEIVVVLLLILANGFFAGAELAIISARHGRIAQLAAGGSRRAELVEELLSDPHRFLATVQIGVTLVGTAASAVGGAAAVEVIKPFLQEVPIPLVANAAEPLALFLVVSFIAYLSLVLGELVPKALALEYSDRIALGVARPIRFLARIGGIPVSILTLSSQTVLRLLGSQGIRGESLHHKRRNRAPGSRRTSGRDCYRRRAGVHPQYIRVLADPGEARSWCLAPVSWRWIFRRIKS